MVSIRSVVHEKHEHGKRVTKPAANDLPVLNVGEVLISRPKIDKVSFIGGTVTGKRILVQCSERMKRVNLEMGGNDAAIVLPDVDVESTAAGVLNAALTNNGQICVAAKRIYVHADIFSSFVEAMVSDVQKRQIGDGMKSGVTLGPVNNRMQLNKLFEIIEDAVSHGGMVRCGGHLVKALTTETGHNWFLAPTIITGMEETCRLVVEEQFGPVIPVMPYTTIEDAIEKANSTRYGLGATVWGGDARLANQVGGKLQAGMVWVNGQNLSLGDAPVGGFKESGLGREGDWGEADLNAYTETQVIKLAK